MNGVSLIVCIFLLFSCVEPRGQVERTLDNGIEVVINHLEPYKIPGVSLPAFEEIFRIDTENTEIEKLGIFDIRGFEVDSRGEIFLARTIRGAGDFIFKFDRNGRFVNSFGRQGQGPGELEYPFHISLDGQDNILITDVSRRMFVKYDKNGAFINGYHPTRGEMRVTSGPGENLLILETSFDAKNSRQEFFLKLARPDFNVRKLIEQYSYEMRRDKFRATEPLFCWSASRDKLFVAKEDRGYEIWIYDSAGTLIRKIRKEYRKIPFTESDKKKILNPLPEGMRTLAYFPEFRPPFQSLVASDEGMLFVPTFEKGSRPGEFMVDIFNKDGAFIGRKSLNIYVWEGHFWARSKADKFYCLREKDSGYKELIVYNLK
jgi:hypothetical protein